MDIILDTLKGINAYPVPIRTILEIAGKRQVDVNEELNTEVLASRGYNLCRADLLIWLSYAPNVTQGGQSYSFTDEQRLHMRRMAQQLYDGFEEEAIPKTIYGYKGKRL